MHQTYASGLFLFLYVQKNDLSITVNSYDYNNTIFTKRQVRNSHHQKIVISAKNYVFCIMLTQYVVLFYRVSSAILWKNTIAFQFSVQNAIALF